MASMNFFLLIDINEIKILQILCVSVAAHVIHLLPNQWQSQNLSILRLAMYVFFFQQKNKKISFSQK